MSDLAQYLEYARTHESQFVNPPDGLITILLDPAEIAEAESASEQRMIAQGATPEQAHVWSRVGIILEDPYVFMLRDAVRFGDGSLGTYDRFVDPDNGVPGVIILGVHQGKVVLVRHFRHAMRQWRIELPRGFGDSGLTNEENALREMREETGAEVERLVSLGMTEPDGGMRAGGDALFFAELKALGQPSVAEGISAIMLMSVAELDQSIADGSIVDGFTLAAYARAKARGLL